MSDSEDDEGPKDRQLKITLIGDGTAGKVETFSLEFLSRLYFTLHFSHCIPVLCLFASETCKTSFTLHTR